MNLSENLLTTLSEEAGEIVLHTSKALRFGLHDGYPGSETTNAQDIVKEIEELNAVYEMLVDKGCLPRLSVSSIEKIRNSKKARVRERQGYSSDLGTLEDENPNSAEFKEFGWRFANIIIQADVALGNKPHYQRLRRYINNVEPLLLEYGRKILSLKGPQGWEKVQQQILLNLDPKTLPFALKDRNMEAIALLRLVEQLDFYDPVLDGLLSAFKWHPDYLSKVTASMHPSLERLFLEVLLSERSLVHYHAWVESTLNQNEALQSDYVMASAVSEIEALAIEEARDAVDGRIGLDEETKANLSFYADHVRKGRPNE